MRFSKILRERKPCKLWVDKGKEFYNNEKENIWQRLHAKMDGGGVYNFKNSIDDSGDV